MQEQEHVALRGRRSCVELGSAASLRLYDACSCLRGELGGAIGAIGIGDDDFVADRDRGAHRLGNDGGLPKGRYDHADLHRGSWASTCSVRGAITAR